VGGRTSQGGGKGLLTKDLIHLRTRCIRGVTQFDQGGMGKKLKQIGKGTGSCLLTLFKIKAEGGKTIAKPRKRKGEEYVLWKGARA